MLARWVVGVVPPIRGKAFFAPFSFPGAAAIREP
ncbi:hypothetical protein F0726_02765 [Acidithiobacillus caldus]|nr:hypothetical protein F0726_02765 [Acidithiobacillus caldus]